MQRKRKAAGGRRALRRPAAAILAVIALAVCGLLGTASAASASAAEPEVLTQSGSYPENLSIFDYGTVTLEVDGITVTCTTATNPLEAAIGGSGTLDSTTEGSMQLELRNCTGPFGVNCTSAGQAAGTILTEDLPFQFVYSNDEPGMVIGETNEDFASFLCSFLANVTIQGSVLGHIDSPMNEVVSWLDVEQVDSSDLEGSVNGGSLVSADLDASPGVSAAGGGVELVGAPRGPVLNPEEMPAPFSTSGPSAGLHIGPSNFSCSGSGGATGSGEFLIDSRAIVQLAFSGCPGNFTSEGQPSGTIVTEPLFAEPVYLDEERTDIGLLLKPGGSGVFAEWGSPFIHYVVTGSLVVDVDENLNEVFETFDFTTNAPQQVEETGPTYSLETSINGGSAESTEIANETSASLSEMEAEFVEAE